MRMMNTQVSAMKERRLIALNKAEAATSPYNYNISRGFGSFKDVTLNNPLGIIGATTDAAHALLFKPGTDLFRAIRGEKESLPELGGISRVKQSTLDAVGNVLGGVGKIVTGKPLKGIAQGAEGVFDALDIIPGAAADGIRAVTGPKPKGAVKTLAA